MRLLRHSPLLGSLRLFPMLQKDLSWQKPTRKWKRVRDMNSLRCAMINRTHRGSAGNPLQSLTQVPHEQTPAVFQVCSSLHLLSSQVRLPTTLARSRARWPHTYPMSKHLLCSQVCSSLHLLSSQVRLHTTLASSRVRWPHTP
jgi:hypothetical protein